MALYANRARGLYRAAGLAVALSLLLTPTRAAQFDIERQPDKLRIAGLTSSTGHDETLRSTAAALFVDVDIEFQLQRGVQLPAGWSLLTELALRVLAETRTGSATIITDELSLRGTYDDEVSWQRAVGRLTAALPEGMRLHDEAERVAPVEPTVAAPRDAFADLCKEQFRRALHERRVAFRINSSELRSSTYPLLDALVEVAADCPAARIHITGHTDASGDAELNQSLSRLRANAVLNYLAARGIGAERLSASGAGASKLLDDNRTAAARARNRRIEFEFDIPENAVAE